MVSLRNLLLLVFSMPLSGFILAQSELGFDLGELIYQNALAQEEDLEDWILEGPAKLDFKDGWMHMFSPAETGHHVLWCPKDFPSSFVATWELQNMELDAGLCIVFFAAQGAHGQSIFDPGLKERDGVFAGYTKSDINCYHISYYAHTPNAPNRPFSHLRKNAGFQIVHEGKAPISPLSKEIHLATLLKNDNQIIMYLDDRKIIDWVDDGQANGPVLGRGKIGFRQMQSTHFRYRNFKVWSVDNKSGDSVTGYWPRHVIDNSSEGADGVKLGDINQDGKPDIVTGWEEGGVTKLYLNPGSDKVTEKWPLVDVGKTPHVEDAVFMDIDTDGHLEIITSTENRSEKIYVHRALSGDFLDSTIWHREVLPASDSLMMWMYAEPCQIDNENGVDLVAAGKGDNASIGWFEAPDDGRNLSDWTYHEISSVGWIMSIILRDMDQDGDTDIVISDRRGDLRGCRWLENPGPGEPQTGWWKNHFIGAGKLEVMFMCMADLDEDGIEEAVVSERTHQTIRIYKRSAEGGSLWHETVIQLPDSVRTAKSVEVGDINGDKVLDFVISTNTNGKNTDGLFWLDGNQRNNPKEQDFISISGKHNAKYDKVELIDLDEDGDLDVLICEENYGEGSRGLGVIWYENELVNKK